MLITFLIISIGYFAGPIACAYLGARLSGDSSPSYCLACWYPRQSKSHDDPCVECGLSIAEQQLVLPQSRGWDDWRHVFGTALGMFFGLIPVVFAALVFGPLAALLLAGHFWVVDRPQWRKLKSSLTASERDTAQSWSLVIGILAVGMVPFLFALLGLSGGGVIIVALLAVWITLCIVGWAQFVICASIASNRIAARRRIQDERASGRSENRASTP